MVSSEVFPASAMKSLFSMPPPPSTVNGPVMPLSTLVMPRLLPTLKTSLPVPPVTVVVPLPIVP